VLLNYDLKTSNKISGSKIFIKLKYEFIENDERRVSNLMREFQNLC
jgi:hypothetical protein